MLQINVPFGDVGFLKVVVGQDALSIDLDLSLVPKDQALLAQGARPEVLLAWCGCLFFLFFLHEELAVCIQDFDTLKFLGSSEARERLDFIWALLTQFDGTCE